MGNSGTTKLLISSVYSRIRFMSVEYKATLSLLNFLIVNYYYIIKIFFIYVVNSMTNLQS